MSNQSRNELTTDLRRQIRSAQVAVGMLDQAAAEHLGINATDHRCLDVLDQHGEMTASALADALGLSRSAVTTVIDRLERLRYVRRRSGVQDRREVLVELTPLLRGRARRLYGDEQEVVSVLERYSLDELRVLRDFVRWDRELNERRVAKLTRSRARGR